MMRNHKFHSYVLQYDGNNLYFETRVINYN